MICMSPLSRRRVVTARGTQGYFSPSPSQEVKEAAHSCAVEEGAGVGGQYPPLQVVGGWPGGHYPPLLGQAGEAVSP